ncbi:amidohydrolase family protein [Muricauda sp. 334s03]|uniref:Amidohydrolase family protein n=1 Tax=Flagellimonas yonaguniensis TaxID=3031325 RepID=A0ABT5XY57_9FLAO|nr:amidohydrolase family protein [[Muricauda] yonaguniensis]MDF0716122.1 amidohydrolase family protein [[Muricauda] yonaguniensis]
MLSRFFSFYFLTLLLLSCEHTQKTDDITYDLWIKNANVVDGMGSKSYRAHVLVLDDEIAKIEKDTKQEFLAQEQVDATNSVLTPGFIDTHAHGDPIEDPEFKNFLAMGVTTIALGQDGYSPREKDLSGWMQKVDSVNSGVNIAMFVGHNTIRQLSGVNYEEVPSEEGLAEMKRLLNNAFEVGVFGMTSGLEYNPGSFSKKEELEELAKVVGKRGGLIMSHMRNEDDTEVEQSIRELLSQGKYCPVHVSHIKSVYGKGEERGREILKLLDSAKTEGVQVTADLYPYTASYTGIAIVFPDWAKKPHDFDEVVANRKSELQKFLRNKIAQRNGPQATLIGSGEFAGKNLQEISKELNKPFEDVLIEDIGPYGASGAYFIMDETLQRTLVQSNLVNICSDGSPTMRHPRGYGSFPKVIENYVNKDGLFTLEEAIYKMTGLAAKTMGLQKRGVIQEGFKADLLLFAPADIKATATFENPHQLAEGFDEVWVNGKRAIKNAQFSDERFGKILRKEVSQK